MSKKTKILISLTAIVLAIGGISYFSFARESDKPGSGVSTGSESHGPTATPSQQVSVTGTPTAPPSTADPAPPSSDSSGGPNAALAGLVDARFNNDESRARQFGSDVAVRQIYSFPRFNIREATVSCSEQGDKATCSVSSPAAGGSMIVSLSKSTAGWRVEQIEPVID